LAGRSSISKVWHESQVPQLVLNRSQLAFAGPCRCVLNGTAVSQGSGTLWNSQNTEFDRVRKLPVYLARECENQLLELQVVKLVIVFCRTGASVLMA
jgi:hypothetical protein